ncbi:MAG: LacI family DNA-binding transcriptional regulator [Lentisphaeria bacterium]|jgi:transcriptional regulator with XRE-family HTH domain
MTKPSSKPFGRVTAKDVAERAGVSRSLVSMYLSGNKNAWLSESTKQRIDEVIKTLHYRPNTLAQALRSGKTNTIGLLMGGIADPVGGMFAEAVMDEVEKRGYRLFIAVTRFDRKRERDALANMLNYQIDGIIYTLSADSDDDFFRSLENSSCPILLTENHPEIKLDSVCFDLRPGMRDAIRHLEAQGCRRVLCLTGYFDRTQEQLASLAGEFACKLETYRWNLATNTHEEFMERVLLDRPDGILVQGNQGLDKTAWFPPDYQPRIVEFNMLPRPVPALDGVIHLPFRRWIGKMVDVLVGQIERPSARRVRVEIPTEFVPQNRVSELLRSLPKKNSFSTYATSNGGR